METTQISIDLDVYKEIQSRLTSFRDSPNQVLRRVFNLAPSSEEDILETKEGGLIIKGVLLKNGLKLRKNYKGRLIEAVIKDNMFFCNGKIYPTPAAAARAETNTSINAWTWWQYFDDASGSWKSFNELR
jgi:hypothetical protein